MTALRHGSLQLTYVEDVLGVRKVASVISRYFNISPQKVKFALERATKAQRGSRGIVPLFLF